MTTVYYPFFHFSIFCRLASFEFPEAVAVPRLVCWVQDWGVGGAGKGDGVMEGGQCNNLKKYRGESGFIRQLS